MAEFGARYFDGRQAIAHDVRVSLDALGLTIARADGGIERWNRDEIVAKDGTEDEPVFRLTTRRAPEAQLVVADPAAILALTSTLRALRDRVPRRRHAGHWLGLTAGAVAVVGAIVIAIDQLPSLAAPLVPSEWEAWLGDQIVASFGEDDGFCQGAAGRAALDDLTQRLSRAADLDPPATVHVIDWKLVNAFAVPGGRIGIFRGLIEEAESADEVAGVLAHEMGHVVHRHPTEGVLRQLGVSATLQLLLGGSGAGVQDAAGLGNTLLTLSYSRGAEAEADATALEILVKAGLDGGGLNRFFVRLEREDKLGGAVPSLLLTHPPTAERLAATANAPKGAPALTESQWQALRKICD
jgi:beta-barrel assembly-enhancing protease